jgi:Cof subfamily protein (haloacid dehalogenase superfamily)
VTATAVKLMLADVDGTLVTPDKTLTDRAIAAVQELRRREVLFAVTSGRPPRGMSMLVEPLGLDTPIAAFNGGMFVSSDMSVLEQKALPSELVTPIMDLLGDAGLDVWLYQGADWYVRDPQGPHVEREAWTVRFDPTVVSDYRSLTGGVAKMVGVSDDTAAVSRAAERARERFGEHVSAACSQPYYVDITHPEANKGAVVGYLSRKYGIEREAIATIGDMPNDVLMFAHSGLSIAMGNASPEVHRAARRVTATNEDDGFARAVERYVLPTL